MVLSGSTSPMHCIPSPTQLQHPPRDDPTISRWLLLRFVSRCIEQTKLNDGSLTKALPAGCQQHRLEAYLRHMHQMLDGIAEISYPVHQAISIDNLSAQVQVYSEWVEEQKLKLSLEQHQKQLKGPHHHHRQQQPSKSHIFDQDAQETHTTSLSQQGDVYADTDADADADAIRTAAIARHRHDVLNLPLYLPTHSSKSGGSAVSETLLGEMELQPLRKRKTGSERSELFRNSESRDNSVDTSDTAGHTTNALALILERNRKLQDGLSGDLARHAEQLKMTSLLFRDKLITDAKVLSETDEQLGQNLTRLQRERRSIKAFTSKSWGTTFLIWGSIIGVILLFMFTFMVMRIASPVRYDTTHASRVKTTINKAVTSSFVPNTNYLSSSSPLASTLTPDAI
ncbi:hypothetical protein BASA81_004307 [Batrachochytrium salamandrivorans]|nr:hypothetical protein BASA81_004307 [Batrachochytrium salamandrivorans]